MHAVRSPLTLQLAGHILYGPLPTTIPLPQES